MNELILATHNPGKIKELKALLHPIHCIPQDALGILEPEETGLSFIENAILKARHASQLGGKPALADDSGLVVDALGGKPGIYSARFAGANATSLDNIHRLLEQLKDVPDERRGAYFFCAIALVQHPSDPTPVIATGTLNGFITQTIQGNQGFGYDPVFFLTDYGVTVAELDDGIKNTLSHRAKALHELKNTLK